MNKKNLRLLCAALLSFNLFSPVKANVLNTTNTTFPDAITPTIFTAATLYIGYNYLVREEHLVSNLYPHAQTWYNDMAKKYPAANLNSIRFIKKPELSLIPNYLADLAKICSWNASYNHIYFSKEALKEITYVYKKVIDGYALDENEQFALARHEFILLHEAGHIAHSESKNIISTVIGLLVAKEGAEYVYNYMTESKQTTTPTPKENTIVGQELPETHYAAKVILPKLGFPATVPGILATVQGATLMAGLVAVLRYGESQADAFAFENLDTQALQGALTLFENNEVDGMFELETQTITPFIQTKSTVENIIQTVVGPVEFTALLIQQQFGLALKATSVTRWLYDFSQDALHEGPSIRAQKMKNEIARRNNQK